MDAIKKFVYQRSRKYKQGSLSSNHICQRHLDRPLPELPPTPGVQINFDCLHHVYEEIIPQNLNRQNGDSNKKYKTNCPVDQHQGTVSDLFVTSKKRVINSSHPRHCVHESCNNRAIPPDVTYGCDKRHHDDGGSQITCSRNLDVNNANFASSRVSQPHQKPAVQLNEQISTSTALCTRGGDQKVNAVSVTINSHPGHVVPIFTNPVPNLHSRSNKCQSRDPRDPNECHLVHVGTNLPQNGTTMPDISSHGGVQPGQVEAYAISWLPEANPVHNLKDDISHQRVDPTSGQSGHVTSSFMTESITSSSPSSSSAATYLCLSACHGPVQSFNTKSVSTPQQIPTAGSPTVLSRFAHRAPELSGHPNSRIAVDQNFSDSHRTSHASAFLQRNLHKNKANKGKFLISDTVDSCSDQYTDELEFYMKKIQQNLKLKGEVKRLDLANDSAETELAHDQETEIPKPSAYTCQDRCCEQTTVSANDKSNKRDNKSVTWDSAIDRQMTSRSSETEIITQKTSSLNYGLGSHDQSSKLSLGSNDSGYSELPCEGFDHVTSSSAELTASDVERIRQLTIFNENDESASNHETDDEQHNSAPDENACSSSGDSMTDKPNQRNSPTTNNCNHNDSCQSCKGDTVAVSCRKSPVYPNRYLNNRASMRAEGRRPTVAIGTPRPPGSALDEIMRRNYNRQLLVLL